MPGGDWGAKGTFQRRKSAHIHAPNDASAANCRKSPGLLQTAENPQRDRTVWLSWKDSNHQKSNVEPVSVGAFLKFRK